VEVGQIQFIVAWVTIIGTTLGAVFAAFAFLHREVREGFKRQNKRMDRQDERMDRQDAEIKGLRTDVTGLQVGIARIEGHLGIGFPGADEPQEPSEHPDCAA